MERKKWAWVPFDILRPSPQLWTTSLWLSFTSFLFCSVVKLCLTLLPHRLQHARLPCPSLSSWVCSNSCPLSWWCHPTTSCRSLLLPPSIFPSVRVFSNKLALQIRWPSTGASTSTSVFPMSILSWFPLGLTGLLSSQSRWLSRVFSNSTIRKHQFFGAQTCLSSNSHIRTWLLEKPELWLYELLSGKWCLCFLIHSLGLSSVTISVKCELPSCVWLFVTLWLEPARLLCPWDSPGKNTRVCCHFLLQAIFLTQGSNPGLLHCRKILYHLSHPCCYTLF